MMIVNERYEIAVEDGEGFNEIILKISSHNGFGRDSIVSQKRYPRPMNPVLYVRVSISPSSRMYV